MFSLRIYIVLFVLGLIFLLSLLADVLDHRTRLPTITLLLALSFPFIKVKPYSYEYIGGVS